MMHDIIRHHKYNSSSSIENEWTPKQSLKCLFEWTCFWLVNLNSIKSIRSSQVNHRVQKVINPYPSSPSTLFIYNPDTYFQLLPPPSTSTPSSRGSTTYFEISKLSPAKSQRNEKFQHRKQKEASREILKDHTSVMGKQTVQQPQEMRATPNNSSFQRHIY